MAISPSLNSWKALTSSLKTILTLRLRTTILAICDSLKGLIESGMAFSSSPNSLTASYLQWTYIPARMTPSRLTIHFRAESHWINVLCSSHSTSTCSGPILRASWFDSSAKYCKLRKTMRNLLIPSKRVCQPCAVNQILRKRLHKYAICTETQILRKFLLSASKGSYKVSPIVKH